MINVIELSTKERQQETAALWGQLKPRVLKGENMNVVLKEVRGSQNVNPSSGWYKDLIEHIREQGYDYHDFIGKRTGGRQKKKK